jgi:gentisate 1,2-dioxygenase
MTLTTRDAALPARYSESLEAQSLGPLWSALHQLLPSERGTRAVSHAWSWRAVRPLLHEAARLVPIEQAERRVLVLENPGLRGTYSITATLYAGLQIILPGEAAPSHHHTPAALRLVVEGDGAYTTVEGVRCDMEPGDLVITPPMRWHDHGHQGREPMVWLDGLDIPLVRAFDASWASAMRPAEPPRAGAPGDLQYPQVRWAWKDTRVALEGQAAATRPGEPVILPYLNPRTGAAPLATMGAEAQWLRPRERTRAARRTTSAVFHVIEGRGESRIADRTLAWERGDTFVAPPWHWCEHANAGDAPACLFQFNDEPAVRALNLYRAEFKVD